MIPRGQRWFDTDPEASFEEKVKRAVTHYARKGIAFATVYVHPCASLPKEIRDLEVRQDPSILPGYFHFVTQLTLDKSRESVV